jgi:hypothetical protein
MKRKTTFLKGILIASLFASCSSPVEDANPAKNTSGEKQEEKTKQENSFFGSYSLTDMIPETGGKQLEKAELKYLEDTKKRTLKHTTLTINEDGTFKREFPHPSGNGEMNSWTGTYSMNEQEKTMVFNAEIKEKIMPIDFVIEEKSSNKLVLKSKFGQIFMSYVYSK